MKKQSQIVLMASLLSLLNLSIGETDLRVSMGIIVMVVGILLFEDINPISLSCATGVGVFIMRLIEASFVTGLDGKIILSIHWKFSSILHMDFYFIFSLEKKIQNKIIQLFYYL